MARSLHLSSDRAALEATLAAYQSDMADFASLYQAELQRLELERAARIARAATRIERIRVEAAAGIALDEKEGR